MSTANLAIFDPFGRQVRRDGATAGSTGGSANVPGGCVYPLPGYCRSRAMRVPTERRREPTAGWQIREDRGKYDVPDPTEDDSYAPERALYSAADAHTKGQRDAMALLDDAENLVDVLLASLEQESDSRAMQADTVLRVVKKKLRKAHNRIDREETRHRNLFLAYFELEARFGKEAE